LVSASPIARLIGPKPKARGFNLDNPLDIESAFRDYLLPSKEGEVADDLVVLKLTGADVRNGQIQADAFFAAARKFVATIYFFERIYDSRDRRAIDLNVATLVRENPMYIGFRPSARAKGVAPYPAVHWALEQMETIANGLPADPRVPLELLDNIADLADREAEPQIVALSARMNGAAVEFDERLNIQARRQRTSLVEKMPAPMWRSGVMQGSLLGELRGVTDIDGEREFFLRPPVGPARIKCIFPEEMRKDMNRWLFNVVRLKGLLHYDGLSPHPSIVEAQEIDGAATERPHLLEMRGLFSNSEYPSEPDELLQ
jgi:hypothetical protein